MQMSDLRPASHFAKRFGVKAVIFGAPGSGKTPLINTAPRPVMLVTEPGLLSMRGSNVPVWMADTVEKIKDFMDWVTKSGEARNFDTLAVDSLTNIAEIHLAKAQKAGGHGMRAYGQMAEAVYTICNDLFYLPNKHCVLLAKEKKEENGRMTVVQDGKVIFEPVMQKRPSFPGQDLNVKIPHLFDSVLHLGKSEIPGMQGAVRCLRTVEIPEIFARERSGKLLELEPPDLSYIFTKALS